MITLKYLASKLNLSVSTVSKALNDSEEISEKTTRRVKELAKHLNYKPNTVALSLKRNATKTIGVVIPDILNHFFAQVLHSIEKEAANQGYSIITCLSNELTSKEINGLRVLSNGSVDGFIVAIAEETQLNNNFSHINDVLNDNIPMVLYDRVNENIHCDKIVSDDFEATYNATKYLISENRKHILLISNIDDLSVGKLRVEGYMKALTEDSGYMNQPIILSVKRGEDVQDSIEDTLIQNDSIDGILSIDNVTGIVALNTVLKLNYAVPKDMSIIGFSDNEMLHLTNPKLSNVSQDAYAMGKKAVIMLLNRIKNQDLTTNFKTHIIETTFNKRATTL